MDINKDIEKIGSVGFVEYLDASEANRDENSRIEWTTQLAAISRGKDKSANPPKRYEALKKEAEGEKPSRPFEFLPIVLDRGVEPVDLGITKDDDIYKVMKFSHDKDGFVFTNMRALINGNAKYELIPYNEKIGEFAAFKIFAPMFVWAQIVTHTQLSTESQSDRVAEETVYWLPDDIQERIDSTYGTRVREVDKIRLAESVTDESWSLTDSIVDNELPETREAFLSWMINTAPQRDVQLLLKKMGYPREIWSRAPYYFKMKSFVITGWVNNDDAWPHFLRERNAYMNDGGPKNWTQPETQKYAYAIRLLLERNMGVTKEQILGE